jgi:hypothetical protein
MGHGRPMIGDRPMTAAERQRRSRRLRKAAALATALESEGSDITSEPASRSEIDCASSRTWPGVEGTSTSSG